MTEFLLVVVLFGYKAGGISTEILSSKAQCEVTASAVMRQAEMVRKRDGSHPLTGDVHAYCVPVSGQ